MRNYRHHPFSLLLRILVTLSAIITAGVVLFLIRYILYHGVPNLAMPGLFSWKFTAENQSMMPAIINTVIMIFISFAARISLSTRYTLSTLIAVIAEALANIVSGM